MARRSASFSRVILAALCLAVLVVGGKGVMLYTLSKSIDAHAKTIAAFYADHIQQYVVPLQSIPGLTGAEKTSLTELASTTPGSGSTNAEFIGSIVDAQKGFLDVLQTAAVAGTLIKQPQLTALELAFARGGGVQPLLDSYNKLVQQWNLQRESGLGAVYAKLFGLGPKLLLQADGKTEYETTVTL